MVTPAKNLWHCFGCGIGGGPIDWVMKRRGVSFRHAVELLRADVGLTAGDGTAEPGARRARLVAPVALDAGEQELLDQVIGYCHETLLASPEALAYLERRGIASRELIEQHRLGYANRTLGLRLPVAQVKAGAEVRRRLQKIGLIRESGHEHFNGALVVPMDANEYAPMVTPADKSLGLLIRKAVWLGKGGAPAEAPGQHVEEVANAAPAEPAPEPSSLDIMVAARQQGGRPPVA